MRAYLRSTLFAAALLPASAASFFAVPAYAGEKPVSKPSELASFRRSTWVRSFEAIQHAGIPRDWEILGPIADKGFRLFEDKKGLEPDRTDDWRGLKPAPDGKPCRLQRWSRPKEDTGSYVNLGSILTPTGGALAYARTEIDWPVDGPAHIWFDTVGRSRGYLNNTAIFKDKPDRYHRPSADRKLVTVNMKRGKNILKFKVASKGGSWGFYLRIERSGSAHRIKLLDQLMAWHPAEARGWRGAAARMEIARYLESHGRSAEAIAAYRRIRKDYASFHEYVLQATAGEKRIQSKRKDDRKEIERTWQATWLRCEEYLKAGHADAADNEMRHFIARYPFHDLAGSALLWRGVLRQDAATLKECVPYYERALQEFPHLDVVRSHGRAGLRFVRTYRTERLLVETTTAFQNAVENARRHLRKGATGDVRRAVEALLDALHRGRGALIRVQTYPRDPRYVGIREQVRRLLSRLPAESRTVYRKWVERPSLEAYLSAASHGEPSELIRVAEAYPLTPAAARALVTAGNLYLDRGAYAQAIPVLRELMKDYARTGEVAKTRILAKLARAHLQSGYPDAAREALDTLSATRGLKKTLFAGGAVNGEQFVARLRSQLAELPEAGSERFNESTYTFSGNNSRTGGSLETPRSVPESVCWIQDRVRSPLMDRARGKNWPDLFPHLQSHPVAANGVVYVTTLDSVQALDLVTGRTKWTQRWRAWGEWSPGQREGYPVSCATVLHGRLYMRAMEKDRTDVRCLAAENGRLLWSTQTLRALRNAVWLSDPVLVHGMAIAVYLTRGHLNTHGLAAVDARTGALKWKRPLVTGNTGIKLGSGYCATSSHLGPPAVLDDVVFAPTGANAMAALDVFTGEPAWLSTYPRTHMKSTSRGNTGMSRHVRMRQLKWLARGPASPVIHGSTVVLTPKDGTGLIGFDTHNGAVRWKHEIDESVYLAGVCNGNVLAIGHTLKGIGVDSGRLKWEHDLGEASLRGRPGFAGGHLYVPTDKGLLAIDASTGKATKQVSWDERVQPIGNLLVTENRIVGVNDTVVAALTAGKEISTGVWLAEARMKERGGDWAVAAQRFGRAIAAGYGPHAPYALCGRARALTKLGRSKDALSELQTRATAGPRHLSTRGGQWRVKMEAILEGQQARPGRKSKHKRDRWKGALTYAWHLPGREARMTVIPAKRGQRILAYTDDTLTLLNANETLDPLWQTYIGTGLSRLHVGPRAIIAGSSRKLTVLDHATGEPRHELRVPLTSTKPCTAIGEGNFGQVASNEKTIFAEFGTALVGYDVDTFKERWRLSRKAGRGGRTLALGFAGSNPMDVFAYYRGPVVYTAYDANTGKSVNVRKWKGLVKYAPLRISGDRKRLVFRPDSSYECVDLANGKTLWRTDELPSLRSRRWPYTGALTITPHGVQYAGTYKKANAGKSATYVLDVKTGKVLHELDGTTFKRLGGTTWLSAYQATVQRMDMKEGKLERIWSQTIPGHRNYITQLSSFVAGDRLYVVYAHADERHRRDHRLRLAVFDWASGESVRRVWLAGSPQMDSQGRFRSAGRRVGDLLLYTAKEGLFAYSTQGKERKGLAGSIARTLKKPELSASRRIEMKRALSELGTPAKEVFLAPRDLELDGDLSEWAESEPEVLDGFLHFVPLVANARWRGSKDLSARVFTAWSNRGILVAADVRDDHAVFPRSGTPRTIGDSLRLALNSVVDPARFDFPEQVVCALSLVDGQTVVNLERGAVSDRRVRPEGAILVSPDGTGMRYEVLIPWSLLRRDWNSRPGRYPEMRIGVVIHDDDGHGAQGAMEWGAGLSSDALDPQRLKRITLLNVSRERIKRYRQVIKKVPDTTEALRYLDLICSYKRGPDANKERAREYVTFVRSHSRSSNVIPVLVRLLALYRKEQLPDAVSKVLAVARGARCPTHVLDNFSPNRKSFRFWVHLDSEKTPEMVMICFRVPRYGWARRVYWGKRHVNWGRDGTVSQMRMGDLPESGRWMKLEILPVELAMDALDIEAIGLTTWGGLAHFDRITSLVAGKERVLVDDAFPEKYQVQGNRGKFVREPRHHGKASWTAGLSKKLRNTSITAPNRSIWFSFKDPKAVASKPHSAKFRQKQLREVAELVPDTPEAWSFLRGVLSLYPSKVRVAESIKECEGFLKRHPDTVNVLSILESLLSLYNQQGEKDAVARCEKLMNACKLPRDARRGFYTRIAATWTEWHVVGPFEAVGGRRGLDYFMEPERAVDLKWTTKGPAGLDLKWVPTPKPAKGKKPSPYVDIHGVLVKRLEKETRSRIERGPYFAYAYRKISVPYQRKAVFFYGVDDAVSIWCNGRKVVTEDAPGTGKDTGATAVSLRSGENEILIKVGTRQGRCGFYFRIADVNGRPFGDLALVPE